MGRTISLLREFQVLGLHPSILDNCRCWRLSPLFTCAPECWPWLQSAWVPSCYRWPTVQMHLRRNWTVPSPSSTTRRLRLNHGCFTGTGLGRNWIVWLLMVCLPSSLRNCTENGRSRFIPLELSENLCHTSCKGSMWRTGEDTCPQCFEGLVLCCFFLAVFTCHSCF